MRRLDGYSSQFNVLKPRIKPVSKLPSWQFAIVRSCRRIRYPETEVSEINPIVYHHMNIEMSPTGFYMDHLKFKVITSKSRNTD